MIFSLFILHFCHRITVRDDNRATCFLVVVAKKGFEKKILFKKMDVYLCILTDFYPGRWKKIIISHCI